MTKDNHYKELLPIECHTGEWANSPYGPAMVTKPGKISRGRVILNYDVDYLYTALRRIEISKLGQMPDALKILKEKIDTLALHINEVLIAHGDVDPRHGQQSNK
jgi:hypothetical protein